MFPQAGVGVPSCFTNSKAVLNLMALDAYSVIFVWSSTAFNHRVIVFPLSGGRRLNWMKQLPWSLSRNMSSATSTTASKTSLHALTCRLCLNGGNSGNILFLPTLLKFVSRYLRQGYEFDPPFNEKEKSTEKDSKKEKSNWSGLYTKMCILFPYLWPKGKLGLQGMIVTRVPKKIY